MFSRPLTGSVAPAVVALVATYAPVHADEHLIQAWSAIEAAMRDEKVAENLAFARTRLDCARAVGHLVKPRKQAAFRSECASLEAAIRRCA